MNKHQRKANYLTQNENRGSKGADRGWDANLTPRQRKRINKKLARYAKASVKEHKVE